MTSQSKPGSAHQDIDLVEIAATLVRNRFCFFVVFAVVFLLGTTYAMLAPPKYEYESLIRVAESKVDGVRKPLEPLEATRASINAEWIPALLSDYSLETDDELPFEIEVDAPSGSALIRLTSVGSEQDRAIVKTAHKALLEQAELHLSALRQETEGNLKDELQSVEEMIDNIGGREGIADALMLLLQRKSHLEHAQRSLRAAQILVVARQGSQKVAPNRLLIIIASFAAAIVVGIFAALFVRFVRSVRSQLNDDKA